MGYAASCEGSLLNAGGLASIVADGVTGEISAPSVLVAGPYVLGDEANALGAGEGDSCEKELALCAILSSAN